MAGVVGDACVQHNSYSEDVALMAALGHNTYRFTIVWSGGEPAPGEISAAALLHHRRMLHTCRGRGIAPLAATAVGSPWG